MVLIRINTTWVVCTSGSCDLILQDLKTTDAGKYISKVFASGQLPDIYTYDIRVNLTLTGQKGKELMFDDLPREAESVTHLTNAGCTEVWRRGQESGTESKDKLDSTHEDETHDTERVSVWVWIATGVVFLVAPIVFAVNKMRRNRNKDSYQEVQMTETVQGPRSSNNSNRIYVMLLRKLKMSSNLTFPASVKVKRQEKLSTSSINVPAQLHED
ncbi:hypothetical protein G5714_019101 [Onychostoma macrolepis]|uniref:Uncharacterized protein n=1 Tax=Onychostoma macrolepis TaxID=369639 RepID=A0A7J6C2Q0_9TELE|nr:hypothetical protein G5714_019101 [Onychostoma macrolepis]